MSQEMVDTACEAIVREGNIDPKTGGIQLEPLRQKMIQMHGVGGGNQTLLPMLHNWIERNKQILKKSGSDPLVKALDEIRQSRDLAQTDVPSEFETLASQMVKAMWQQALSVSDTKVQMGRIETLEEENDRLRLQLMDYQEVKAKLAGMELAYKHVLEQMQLVVRNNERLVKLGDSKEVNDFLEEINRLQKQVEKLSETNQLLQDKVADADAQAEQASELRTTLNTVSQERDKLNIQVTQLAERNRELLIKSQRLEATLASKVNEIDELKAQLVAQPILPSAPVFGTEDTSSVQTIQALTERNQFLEKQLKELYEKFGQVQEELVQIRERNDSQAAPQDKIETNRASEPESPELNAQVGEEAVSKPVQEGANKSRATRKKNLNK
ncbi:hypothetical protein H6S82_03595 [Planktothrix sp. FACHB-1355]|nr:hypothetical protein [Planktothrix sp. FACHB-1355]